MRPTLGIVLASLAALLTLAGCSDDGLDRAPWDDESSTLDKRLVGSWEFVSERPDDGGASIHVGKKQGSKNTLEAVVVGLDKDLTVRVERFDIFARTGKRDYLSIHDTITTKEPDATRVDSRWLVARYEFTTGGTLRVYPLEDAAFRQAVRREVIRGGLKGEIKGARRRRSDWTFALPGHEPEKVVLIDSAEAIVRFFDDKGAQLFDQTPRTFKRINIQGEPVYTALPIAERQAASAQVSTRKSMAEPPSQESARGDWAPSLPQSFEVAAKLPRPGDYQVGKLEAFRSVALQFPWVYVLDRTGTLCIFRLPTDGPAKELQPTKILENAGDGNDLKVLGGVLICTRSGSIEAYSLEKPGQPRHVGRFGPKEQVDSQSIVRNGHIAFLVGGKTIQCYDLAVPSKPRFLGTYATKHNGWNGCAAGSFLYVGQSDQPGITIFDVSTPAHPNEVAFVPLSHWPCHVFATPNRRLIVSMDSEERSYWVNEAHISVNGNCRRRFKNVAPGGR